MSSSRLTALQAEVSDLRDQLANHKVYKAITTIGHLRLFMQYHVFAVWDFMSLLKSLQSALTCVRTPWVPVGTPSTRYLINEIVAGEESDVDETGSRISHFELYCRAMSEAGCDTSVINAVIAGIRQGQTVAQALKNAGAPQGAAGFVLHTFGVIDNGAVSDQAAVFTFGREDLIPDMFIELVKELAVHIPGMVNTFKYYLERHIEVDGDHHAHLAYQMTKELCGSDEAKWTAATIAVRKALEARIKLWDCIYQHIHTSGLV